jgi:hypothetical protein
VFGLALAWVPADQPLVIVGDDTLARKGGKSIALPVLFRLYVGTKRGGETNAAGRTPTKRGLRHQAARAAHAQHPRPTKLELLREEIVLVARWAVERRV